MENKLHGEHAWKETMKSKQRYRAIYEDGMIIESDSHMKLTNPNKNGACIVSIDVKPLLMEDIQDNAIQRLIRIIRSGNAYYILAKEEGKLPQLFSDRYTTNGCNLNHPHSSHQKALWETLLIALLDELKKIDFKEDKIES